MGFKKMAEQNNTTSIILLKARFLNLICKINLQKHSIIFESVYSVPNHFIFSVLVSSPQLKTTTLSEHGVDNCFEGTVFSSCKSISRTFMIQNLQQIEIFNNFQGGNAPNKFPAFI